MLEEIQKLKNARPLSQIEQKAIFNLWEFQGANSRLQTVNHLLIQPVSSQTMQTTIRKFSIITNSPDCQPFCKHFISISKCILGNMCIFHALPNKPSTLNPSGKLTDYTVQLVDCRRTWLHKFSRPRRKDFSRVISRGFFLWIWTTWRSLRDLGVLEKLLKVHARLHS